MQQNRAIFRIYVMGDRFRNAEFAFRA
ncbi:hypothetical protein CBM2606_A150014 [Cupriavidus taiwanensis]|nr:hypothetical protein CBM2606_A150014 [Cupriavidus taiwanensis]